jgi:hypothetical protein
MPETLRRFTEIAYAKLHSLSNFFHALDDFLRLGNRVLGDSFEDPRQNPDRVQASRFDVRENAGSLMVLRKSFAKYF